MSEISDGRKWLIATRPFSLPASMMPVIFGSVAAWTMTGAPFRPFLFLGALVSVALLHAGANMLSDVFDFRSGLDVEPTPVSGAIVRHLLSSEAVLGASFLVLAAGCGLGLILAMEVGPPIFWIGAAGVAMAVFYSFMKSRALGDFAVFAAFGLLGALGAWTLQKGQGSLLPVLWSFPIALHVIGILHANNWRDLKTDQTARVRTIAGLLGDRGSERYYGFLLFAPYLLVTLFALPCGCGLRTPRLPFPVALVWLSLPMALKNWKKGKHRAAPRNPHDFIALDGATAQLNLAFGLLYILGLVVGRWTGLAGS
ncbi:MAG: prenyltransferase [Kiritimatiellia bacterium]|nr:prenyltransferase [Kiritimatiellia bacterium]